LTIDTISTYTLDPNRPATRGSDPNLNPHTNQPTTRVLTLTGP